MFASEIVNAAFQPNSFTRIITVDTQGKYSIDTKANVISCTGEKYSARLVVLKIATAPKSTNSLRTVPSISSIPAATGKPSHPTVNGDSALLIGVNTFNAYNA